MPKFVVACTSYSKPLAAALSSTIGQCRAPRRVPRMSRRLRTVSTTFLHFATASILAKDSLDTLDALRAVVFAWW